MLTILGLRFLKRNKWTEVLKNNNKIKFIKYRINNFLREMLIPKFRQETWLEKEGSKNKKKVRIWNYLSNLNAKSMCKPLCYIFMLLFLTKSSQ